MDSSEHDNELAAIDIPMLTIDQAQSKENRNKMKKLATKPNNTDHRCTSINQEGAKINYNDIKITEIYQTDAFYLKNNCV